MAVTTLATLTTSTLPLLLGGEFSEIEKKVLVACDAASENPKIGDLTINGLTLFAQQIVTHANARLGNNPHNVAETVALLEHDLKRYYGLRKKEIALIVDSGIDGLLDTEDVRHFSSSRFCKWIKTYLETQKAGAMKKKAQYDHQALTPPTPEEREVKAQHEAFLGELIGRAKVGDLPKNFVGFDAIFEDCEQMGVFEPVPIEEKQIIAKEAASYTGYTGDGLKSFARKVAYLYVVHKLAGVSYTLRGLVSHVAGHDKSLSGYLQDLAKLRVLEYEEYRKTNYVTYEEQAEYTHANS